ncbi:ERI1 exoribonuclease 2 isoform X3 [Sparus aurata]|uniref:ERI1 exoribonuclease 2 isoform X3 n=1 Tax=Sparus aurata TaxID=8175 RepID=UPI0011C0F1F2|nr:ERI1 exoribonuclease 2 isoform X3 [Sparus aurata]
MGPTKLKERRPSELPSDYKFLKVLGEGVFGKVLKCVNQETREIVAIKMPKSLDNSTENEIPMLRKIKRNNLDKHNIVKYIDCFKTCFGRALVFELLDISLYDYIKKTNAAPMLLSDIRTIIQQMATALDVLKGIEVIHTDLKLDNIMMVDHQRRPFKVKLIDFGLAISRSEVRRGSNLQPRAFRSPEIILGCHFSEAIDMWTLGCAMFEMICGHRPFAGDYQNEIMLSIVRLVGQPADRVLKDGRRTKSFFEINEDKVWAIKTGIEAKKCHEFKSLDDLKGMRLEKNNKTEVVEREQCVELLKAMLKVNADERITPPEVLTHPFITKNYPSNDALASASGPSSQSGPSSPSGPSSQSGPSSPSAPSSLSAPSGPSGPSSPSPEKHRAKSTMLLDVQETTVSEPPAAPLKDEESCNIQPDDCTPSAEILPSGVILVRPGTAENTTLLDDQETTVSEPPAAPLKDEESCNIQPDNCTASAENLPSGVILVRPVTAENTTLLEDQDCTVSEPPAAPLNDEESCNIQPDNCTASAENLPSGVILVRPVTAENTTLLEDQDCTVSEPPAAPLNDEESCNIQPDDCTASAENLPSGVILVRPATAENTTLLDDQKSTVSFQSGLNKTSESSVRNADSNMKTSEDSTTRDTGTKKKRRRKKNYFTVSWLRKTFSCCDSPIN